MLMFNHDEVHSDFWSTCFCDCASLSHHICALHLCPAFPDLPTRSQARTHLSDAVVKFLHFNGAYKSDAGAATEVFKVLVIDDFTLSIVATLLHTEALRQHGVTLVLAIDKDRESIKDAPVVYFIRGTSENAQAIVKDLELGLYREVPSPSRLP